MSIFFADASSLDSNKWFQNQDNCTVTVAGRCKSIDSQLRHSCLGTPLPYEFTSNGPIIDDVAHFDLQTWTALKAVPMCWDKLQIFLCTVYVPECRGGLESPSPASSSSSLSVASMTSTRSQKAGDHLEYSQVVLPERGMCLAVRKACPLLFSGNGIGGRSLLGDIVPKFLQCEVYAPVCRQNKLRPKLFDANKATCQAPLVSTSNNRNWIRGIASCAFPCRSPVYRSEHYTLARSLTFGAAIAGILVNVCVLCTLRLLRSPTSTSITPSYSSPANQKNTMRASGENSGPLPVVMATAGEPCRRLPHTALTFIHLSFLVGCFGFLMPHLPGVGDSIACRADGSVRVGEPQAQAGSPILCVICFMLIYMPLLAVALWSNVLDYALFTAFHNSTTRILVSSGLSPSVFHLRRLGTVGGGVNSVSKRLRRLQRRGRGNDKQPGLLLPPDSSELPKRRLGNSGVNEAMEGSVSPVSPANITTIKRLSSVEMGEKRSRNASWKLGEDGDRSDNLSLPLVCRLIYPNNNSSCTATNDPQANEGQRAAFNSMGSQITCIHIAAFAVPVFFALISLTASEIDGEPLSGLCLVGIRTLWAYCSMVIAPLTLCLLLKIIYLSRAMKSMRRLSGYLLTTSYSPVDREMAHRLSMCFRAYVIYILTLVAFLAFSVGVHAYTYMEEPKWLETQRLFLFCQLRHRLLGLDSTAAAAACRTPFTAGISLFSDAPHAFNSTEVRVRRNIHLSAEDGPEVDSSSSKIPLTGPLLLNLFTYFMLNLVFASMCLLDSTVKRKWFGLIKSLISTLTSCPSKLTQTKPQNTQTTIPSTPRVVLGLNSSNSNSGTNFHLPGTFSWWDPGMFFLDFYETISSTKSPLEVRKQINAENTFISAANRGVATSDVSCGCNRRYSSSTNEESWVLSSVGAKNATSTIRGGIFSGGNASSSVVSSNVTGTVTGTTVGGQSVKPMHKSNSLNSSQSLFMTQRGSGGGHQKSKSSASGAVILNTSALQKQDEGELVATSALERNLTRPIRRSRHRRMWSGKTSGRRRLISRSYSTLGLAGAGGEERRSLNSLLALHRADSSSAASTSNAGRHQQNVSIESLSRLYAAAAAMELKRSRKILDSSGSRRGTTSHLSLASSSGAESYNSFQLLAEQAGATWRELCRTRMLLIDALHWAQSAAAAAAENSLPHQQIPPQPTDQQQLIAATSVMMAYLMGQQQQNAQNIQPLETCCPMPTTAVASTAGDGTPDSVMMAALMAATAAAQAAMQHQQHPIQNPGLGVPISAMPTMPATPLKQLSQMSNPSATFLTPSKGCCQIDLLSNRLPQSSLTKTASTTPGASFRGSRHDVVCHLDASANAGIVSPTIPSRSQQHQSQPRSPWILQSLHPPGVWSGSASTDLSQFVMSLGAPSYAFVPPPTVHMISQSLQPPPPNITNPTAELDEDDEGSDAFDSEDEVMSTSGDEAADVRAQRRRSHRPITADVTAPSVDPTVPAKDYWEEEDPFPTPEGQPSCIVPPSDDSVEVTLDPDADDVSSVSQSASQVVVATVHEEDKGEKKRP
ncbi:hypothetical protein Aperf_G00000106724 [Anoplocephala perfoliata]